MTPAEELLAAVKEHATADVSFEFVGCGYPALFFESVTVAWHVGNGTWYERSGSVDRTHPTASSAVQSAFARARGKQP